MKRKLFKICVGFLLLPFYTIGLTAQELPPEAFGDTGNNPSSIPPEAFQNSPVPTSIDGFGSEPIGGYNPYQDGSFGSLNFDYYNPGNSPNCGLVFKSQVADNSRFQESTELRLSAEYHTNPCPDQEAIERLRQNGQNTRAVSNNLNVCLKLGEVKCPADVRERLLEKVLRDQKE